MEISIQCDCGKVKGTVESTNLKGYRAICLCDDCQTYAHAIHRPDILDANGGTDIIPCTPAQYKFVSGQEQLQCMRLSDKGMFRWYTGCCNSPMGNSMASPAMPYIGLPVNIFLKSQGPQQVEEVFGPVTERMQARFAKGPKPPLAQKTVSLGFLARVLKFIIKAKVGSKGSPSPFFKADGQPLSKPQILSSQEREALRKSL